jgi:hypothetical protein
MNINDIHRYVQRRGVGGYHLAASDLDDESLRQIIQYMGAIDDLMQPEVNVAQQRAGFVQFIEVLCEAERALPAPEIQAMVNHQLIHIYVSKLKDGPLWQYWTYVFERFMATLVRCITDRSGIMHYC